MTNYVSLDIGGTKVALYVFDSSFSLLKKEKFSTKELGGGSIKLLDSLYELLQKNITENTKKIGISINAAVKNNVILKSSVLGVDNFPLAKKIEKKFRIPVNVENDSIAFAKAELEKGFGRKYKHLAVLTMGTGTRVNYIQDGMIVNGHQHIAGEISQMKIYVKELKKEFLLDNFISGRGIESVYKLLSGKEKSAKDVFLGKDRYAEKTIALFIQYALWLFELIAYVYNPEIIVLSGSIFNSSDKFLPEVEKMFHERNFSFFHYKIQSSKLLHGNAIGSLLP